MLRTVAFAWLWITSACCLRSSVRNAESHMQFEGRCAPWKVTNDADNQPCFAGAASSSHFATDSQSASQSVSQPASQSVLESSLFWDSWPDFKREVLGSGHKNMAGNIRRGKNPVRANRKRWKGKCPFQGHKGISKELSGNLGVVRERANEEENQIGRKEVSHLLENLTSLQGFPRHYTASQPRRRITRKDCTPKTSGWNPERVSKPEAWSWFSYSLTPNVARESYLGGPGLDSWPGHKITWLGGCSKNFLSSEANDGMVLLKGPLALYYTFLPIHHLLPVCHWTKYNLWSWESVRR
jgi:hypothetical protein